MTEQPKDGGAAVPGPVFTPGHYSQEGMSLRDWFAGQALAGYFGSPTTQHRNATDCASYIYEMADAMIAAREATQ